MATLQRGFRLPAGPFAKAETEAERLIFKLSVTLAADKSAVDPVVEGILQIISQMPCARGKEDAIHVALSEALANAVVHGARSDPSKKIECDISCHKKRGIVIVVRDPGNGFDLAAVPSPIKGKHVFAHHGRGIYLINQLMDEVKFLKNGAEIHMIKR